MPVNDFQTIRKGDLIAVIDPSDYQAQLDLAQANLAAAEATLANLENQRSIQEALVQEAEATIDATEADVLRYQLEDKRQRNLFKTGIAGTQQLVEQADDNAKKAHRATPPERSAARPAEGGAGGDRHSGKAASRPDPRGGGAGRARLRQSALYANSVARRRPRRPAASAARTIRQCRHASDRRPSAAEHLDARELQGNPDDQHPGRPAGPDDGRRLSRPQAHRPRGLLVAGDRQHLRAAAARQRDRQLHQGGPARSGEDRARQQPFAWSAGEARHVGRSHGRHRRVVPRRAAERRRATRRPGHDRRPRPARIGRRGASAPRRRSPAPASPLMQRGEPVIGSAPIRSGPTSASLAF